VTTELQYNNESGTLGAALTSSGTTITFEVAPNFATLTAGQYIKLCLDEGTSSFEIVYLTAYTAGATTGTITRQAEDSTNWPETTHSLGGTWVNAPTVADFGGGGVSSVFTRTGAVVAESGDYTVSEVTGAAPIASPTFTGTTTAPEFSASGLTGATAASRYVGATTSGAPASGTFAVGDFVLDQTGVVWVCVTAGSPGTWTSVAVPVVENVNTVAASGAAQTIPDPAAAAKITWNEITLTAACTFTFASPTKGKSFYLALTQGGSGGYTATWPGTVVWDTEGAPTLSTAVGNVDTFSFLGQGSYWRGYTTGQGFTS
jgi:hypothetical protein